jgi:hypothetical protein
MSRLNLKNPLRLGMAASLALVFSSSAAVMALDPPRPSNVRVPPDSENAPTETGDADAEGNPTATQPRFTCEVVEGEYTVMYHPQSQPGGSYEWAQPSAMGGGWTPEMRCQEIARRLEAYRPDGLERLQTAVENNYNTICVTTANNPDCRIVLTVPPGQDPELTRDRIFENLTVADSGQQTDAVNAIVGNDNRILREVEGVLGVPLPGSGGGSAVRANGIDLRPFLDRADGGTGDRLDSLNRGSSDAQLNPDNFR